MESLGNIAQKKLSVDITEKEKQQLRNKIICIFCAAISLVAGLIYNKVYPDQESVAHLIHLIGVLIIGLPILFRGIKGLTRKDLAYSMEILVSIAVIAAALSGQLILAILIPMILTIMHFFEEKSIIGGKDAITSLHSIQPATALLFKEGKEIEVDATTLEIGDIISVKPGMIIPVDGVVIEGESSINQQSLTGESNPIDVTVSSQVYSGTINIQGTIKVKTEKKYKDTSFQQIVSLLESASNSAVDEIKVIDKFLIYYIPLALVIALMSWLLSRNINRAIAVLVVSCPCGYVLASSVPTLTSFVKAMKKGIIIKDANFLTKLIEAKTIVFDKTGTLTTGKLAVSDYKLYEAVNFEELIITATVATYHSSHPVSKSITDSCPKDKIDATYLVKEFTGKGVIATKGKTEIIVGNTRWMQEKGFDVKDDLLCSPTWIVKNSKIMGYVMLSDALKFNALQVISDLRKLEVEELILLTGDNADIAKKLADELQLNKVYSGVMPQDKLDKVKKLKEKGKVIVVGDGINDALALSEADVGIAMGAIGSDAAIESSDIALMNDDLESIPFVINLAKQTKSIIMQNIAIAFAISFIMIVLASTGIISALLGTAIHSLGAFFVLLNSARLVKFKDKK